MRRMWDAAFPPSNPPKWEVAAGYIGGGTPHVWTDAEWAATKTRWRLPIFVRVPPTTHDPRDDAAKAIAWLRGHDVPKGVCMCLDYETAIDATYLGAFDRTVVAAGWKVMVYGTRRTVLANPRPSGGYWDAQWTNEPHLNAGSAATQYGGDTTLGQPYDASLVADSTPLWDTEGDFTVLDDATKAYLDTMKGDILTRINQAVQRVGGRTNSVYNNNNVDYQGLVMAKDIQQLDATAVAALVAGQLEVTGIQTDSAGVVTVTFGPRSV